jgi:predicted nucleotidyltransferase
MTLDELRGQSREAILAAATRHGVTRVRVFGSFARNEAREDSDVDLLIERGPHRTPFFPGGLIADLEDLLGRRVDVVTESALPERIRGRVLEEAVPL